MEFSYATISNSGREYERLHKEVQLDYLVSDSNNPANHPIYVVEEDMGSCMLHLSNEETSGTILQVEKEEPIHYSVEKQDEL